MKVNLLLARKSGCRFVDFTGGEPLLHPDLPGFLREAKKLGFITSITTNCILFPSRAGELEKSIDLLHFSLDADTAQRHDAIRGAASFDHVMRSIPLALRLGMVPDLLFTYTDDNIDCFEGVARLGREHRLMVLLDPVFSTDGRDRIAPATHLKALDFARIPGVYLNKAHLSLRRAGGNHISKPVCRAVQSTIVISPDNFRVFPCFHHRCLSLPTPESFRKKNRSAKAAEALAMQGKYSFCEGCHINCYFDPSYNYLPNRLFFQSLAAKFSYISMKYFIYGHFRQFLRLYLRAAGKCEKSAGSNPS